MIILSLLLLAGRASSQGQERRDAIERLKFAEPARCAEAAAWLRKQGPAAFGDVMDGFESTNAVARSLTADILLHYAERMESVERYGSALARRLKDPSAGVRAKIGRLLRKAGPKNIPMLVRALAYAPHPLGVLIPSRARVMGSQLRDGAY